ncbi:hypothetical protein GCM10008094_10150 [Aidingimonas halophila]|nr:hypothetical protein GCM10008094_10150 [Aidingimonas halophila]
MDDLQVTLRVKDDRDRDRSKRLVHAGEEFVRRFLLHVLSKGPMRVRHYGFMANRRRRLGTAYTCPYYLHTTDSTSRPACGSWQRSS